MRSSQPPVAKKIPKRLEIHGDIRIDNYFWMNDREDPEVIAYLEAENQYYQSHTEHTRKFQTQLFEEMRARIKEDEELRDIPIIAVTAFAMKGDEEKIRAGGCEAYLAKPISLTNFLETVERYLN